MDYDIRIAYTLVRITNYADEEPSGRERRELLFNVSRSIDVVPTSGGDLEVMGPSSISPMRVRLPEETDWQNLRKSGVVSALIGSPIELLIQVEHLPPEAVSSEAREKLAKGRVIQNPDGLVTRA